MNKIEINIVKDILKSNMALHEFGRPVSKAIGKNLSDMTQMTLFVLNLREADPLDYEFVNIAFEEIVNRNLKDTNLYLAFKAGKWETEELFTGLTKILKLRKELNKTDEDILTANGIHLLIINDNGEPKYFTSLSGKHLNVLSHIQAKEAVSSGDIQQTFDLIVEETSEILSDLLRSKLIYSTVGPIYHSVYSLV
jgi:hypothetical protein